uniref:TIL domain-containing protein n=1 Tax=Heterorhabditis bacteriophora TaxID=37862 RepID=A0A1I7XEB1_HETBA
MLITSALFSYLLILTDWRQVSYFPPIQPLHFASRHANSPTPSTSCCRYNSCKCAIYWHPTFRIFRNSSLGVRRLKRNCGCSSFCNCSQQSPYFSQLYQPSCLCQQGPSCQSLCSTAELVRKIFNLAIFVYCILNLLHISNSDCLTTCIRACLPTCSRNSGDSFQCSAQCRNTCQGTCRVAAMHAAHIKVLISCGRKLRSNYDSCFTSINILYNEINLNAFQEYNPQIVILLKFKKSTAVNSGAPQCIPQCQPQCTEKCIQKASTINIQIELKTCPCEELCLKGCLQQDHNPNKCNSVCTQVCENNCRASSISKPQEPVLDFHSPDCLAICEQINKKITKQIPKEQCAPSCQPLCEPQSISIIHVARYASKTASMNARQALLHSVLLGPVCVLWSTVAEVFSCLCTVLCCSVFEETSKTCLNQWIKCSVVLAKPSIFSILQTSGAFITLIMNP